MGNTQCSQLTSIKAKKSPAYGDYQHIVLNHNQYAMVTKTISKDIITKQQLIQQLQKRKQIDSVSIVNLHGFDVKEEGRFFDIKMQYQYIGLSLAEKVIMWNALGKKLAESELGNIIFGVQKAIKELYQIGIGHRCVNLQTVLCFNSLYKLTDISMITFLTGYDMARQGDQNQLLSSKLLNYLHYQGTDPHYTIQDDLFSLGLLILTIVLGVEPREMYFIDNSNFRNLNRKKIADGLRLLKEKYSQWMHKKVRELVQGGLKIPGETQKESVSRKQTIS